jgi:hypothetical protein
MLSSVTRATIKPTQMASRAFVSTWNAVPQGKKYKYTSSWNIGTKKSIFPRVFFLNE